MVNRALFLISATRALARTVSRLSCRTRTHPSAIYKAYGDLNLGLSVKETEQHLHAALCVRWLLNNSNETIKRATVNTDFLTDLQIGSGWNNATRVSFFNQKINHGIVNRSRNTIETYEPFNSRRPDHVTVFFGVHVDSSKKITGKQRNDSSSTLLITRKKQFRKKNLQSFFLQVKVCRILLLRLAVDRIPKALAGIRHSSHQPLNSREHC
jgi:hypothetical protein